MNSAPNEDLLSNNEEHLSAAVSEDYEPEAVQIMESGAGAVAKDGGDIELDLDPLVEAVDDVMDVMVDGNEQVSEERQQGGVGAEIHDADKLVKICNVKINQSAATSTVKPLESKQKGPPVSENAEPEVEVVAVLPSGQRRCRPPSSKNDRPAVKKAKSGLEDITWESLMTHIHTRFSSMDSDECFLKAMEIAMLARHEVESRSQHLLNAFDMMSRGQSASVAPPPPHPVVHPPAVVRAAVPPVPSPVAAPMVRHDENAMHSQGESMEKWMERYHELKQFQHLNGTCEVPYNPHPKSLGKWTLYQKQNHGSLNSTQMQLLSSIGFQFGDQSKPAQANARFQVHQKKVEQEKQRQVKMHRTTKYSSMEPVPCAKLESPLPPRCEGGGAVVLAELPEFASLVNFPSARYFGNCVMCDDSAFPVPKQNKGVCNNCDTAIWVVVRTGLRIKWCKGCKNFKKWFDFGAKGFSSKCQHCRDLQAHRYALAKKGGRNVSNSLLNKDESATAQPELFPGSI